MRTVAALYRELTADHRHDGELLAAFVSGPSEEAFTELVRRHGPLVWGACRRFLPDPGDAEDAFQAAFLVLIRRARRLTRVSSLGPWMHRVAVWTARNVRRKNARRLARQTAMPDHVTDPTTPPDPGLKVDIDAALLALPSRYRDPIVLCHLLGFSRREAAERLGCPEGTLSAWLSRGLAKLRERLRGLDPAKPLALATVSVPATLSATTARAAVAAVAAGSVSPAVSSLVEGVLHMLWMKKATAATVALFATFALGVGVGLSTRPGWTGAGAQDKAPPIDPLARATPAKETDRLEAQLEARLRAAEARLAAAEERALRVKDLGQAELIVQEAIAATEEIKALKDKLAELKAASQKAAQKPPAGTGLAEVARIDKELVLLREHLAASRLKRTKLAEQAANIEQEVKALDLDVAKLEEMARRLQAKRNELAPEKANEPGAHLEVTVTGKDALWPCRVKEFGADGKPIGSVIAEDLTILAPLLTRAAKDSNGPKEVRIVTQQGAPAERVRAVLDACKRAGFQKVSVSDPTWNPAADPDPRLEKTLREKAELEKYLKQLEKRLPDRP